MDSFVYFVAATCLAVIGVEVWLMRSWSGVWKIVAALPLVVLFMVTGNIIIDVRESPTSHNLWPFEIVIWCGYGIGALLVIAILKAVFSGSNRKKETTGNG